MRTLCPALWPYLNDYLVDAHSFRLKVQPILGYHEMRNDYPFNIRFYRWAVVAERGSGGYEDDAQDNRDSSAGFESGIAIFLPKWDKMRRTE